MADLRGIAAAAALLAIVAGAALGADRGAGAAPAGLGVPRPESGVPATNLTFVGAAPSEGAGEVWGMGRVGRAAPATVGGQPVPAQPPDGSAQRFGWVVMRFAKGAGWSITQEPQDASGAPLPGFQPVGRLGFADMAASGAGAVLGTVTDATGPQQALLFRAPGGAFRKAPPPPAGSDPSDVLHSGEVLFGESQAALAAVDGGAFVGILRTAGGGTAAVARYDGAAWTREPIDAPLGHSPRIDAIDATSAGNAWLLAQPDAGEGVVLYQRTTAGGSAHWVPRPLGGSLFAAGAPAGTGVHDLAPLSPPAQPLTVTADGAWVDGHFTAAAGALSFTIFVDAAGTVKGAFCDVPSGGLCDHPLRLGLSGDGGYRSFAWSGSGLGTRVITNALAPGGGDATNHGAYVAFDGTAFHRAAGLGAGGPDGAFDSVDEGWLGVPTADANRSPVHLTAEPAANQLQPYPVPFRRPLLAVAGEPGKSPGDTSAQALAVGVGGAVARYTPGHGWEPEFLLTEGGSRATPTMRGVAWPEPDRAYAVGDQGQMWLWRSETGLWEPDPAAPVDFNGNLNAIAFKPGDPNTGYAVGRQGVLLKFDKTWTQETLPGDVAGADLESIAFAGSEAVVAFRTSDDTRTGVLVNDGSGWRVDDSAEAALSRIPGGSAALLTVAGLPDGGAVAAGRNALIERDSASGPWHASDQPLPALPVIAAAAVRDGDRVRAVVSVTTIQSFPASTLIPVQGPDQSPQIVPPNDVALDGYLLRETAAGWRDEEHVDMPQPADRDAQPDAPIAFDAVQALLLDPSTGRGWAVGGTVGLRGGVTEPAVQTAGIFRYPPAPDGVPQAGAATVATDAGKPSFVVGGGAECQAVCADLRYTGIAPDVGLDAAQREAAAMGGQPHGPRAFLYTGQRVDGGQLTDDEAGRFAEVATGGAGLPFYSAVGGDASDAGIGAFRSAFASAPAPFGGGAAPAGVDPAGIPGASATGTRTHYAFDSAGPEGAVRVLVVDNASGSLAAGAARQVPPEDQLAWLTAALQDAKAKRIPAIVVGNRDLSTRPPYTGAQVATDADDEVRALAAGGASAYFFESPRANVRATLSSGAAAVPEFGTGTLGYSSVRRGLGAYYGDPGVLLTEVDIAHRDATTNVAPVTVRLIPLIGELALDARDGTELRRSQTAVFAALARRPRSGVLTQGGEFDGPSPYVEIPPTPCFGACPARIEPEYSFSSSNPDIGDFVRIDPATKDLHSVLLDAQGRASSDPTSGTFCAFNQGTTTVTVSSGGLSFSEPVTVLGGSVRRPCGTRPLANPPAPRPAVDRQAASKSPSAPPAPPPAPAGAAPVQVSVPPPPLPPARAPAARPAPAPKAAAPKPPTTPQPSPPVPAGAAPVPLRFVPPAPAPPPRPSPPTGTAVAPVFSPALAPQERREEELAPEESQAAAAYRARDHDAMPAFLIGMLVLAALSGSVVRLRAGGRPTPVPVTLDRYPR